jgi:hypothetical protein
MAVDLSNNILSLIEPAIEPKKLEGNTHAEDTGKNDRTSKTTAIDRPLIVVNNYPFQRDDVKSFNLSSSGLYPTVSVTLIDTRKIFTVDSFPRDGDKMTVFINSKNESTYKSIHMDFEITDISVTRNKEGDPNKVRVFGRASIPKLFAENCQHLEEDTSINHLQTIATELKLGLASNIDETTDLQVRIQPFINYLDFINQIVSTSYISDDSFQNFFIDQYYYLNFIDINKIFNALNPSIKDFQETVSSLPVSYAEEMESSTDNDNIPTKLFLTNKSNFSTNNNYVGKYRIINQSNTIDEIHGHFRDVQIYDDNAEERLDEFRIEALSTDPANLTDIQEPLKGNRESEEYLDLVKHKYMGRQEVGEEGIGNVHQNYIFAQLHNRRNFDETQKIKLEVTLPTFNPSLYRYMKIPVLLYHIDQEQLETSNRLDDTKKSAGFSDSAIDNGPRDEPKPDQILDQFLSGYYIVESIDISYKDTIGNFTQKVTLIRREWPARISAI